MKAAGITLSTVGAGGGANPFLEQLAKQGGGRFYAAANPSSIPDIFLKETQQVAGQQIVEEAFFPIQTGDSPILRGLEAGLPAAPRLQRHDDQVGRPAGARLAPRRPAPRPVAVRARPVRGLDVGLDRSLGQELGRLVRLHPVLQPARRAGRSRARRPAGSRRRSRRSAARPGCTSRASRATARRATSTGRWRRSSGRTSCRARSLLDQVAPGVYEQDLGEIDSGAYAVRITQTRPGVAGARADGGARGAGRRRVPAARA